MRKIDVGQVIQIFANVGVIASIVFLAIQVQQNSNVQRAQARATRAQIRIDSGMNLLENTELREAAMRQRRGEPLSDMDIFMLEVDARLNLTRWQYIYGEYREGLIEAADVPTEDWRRVYGGRPEFDLVWKRTASESFRPDFVSWMNANVVNVAPAPATVDATATPQ